MCLLRRQSKYGTAESPCPTAMNAPHCRGGRPCPPAGGTFADPCRGGYQPPANDETASHRAADSRPYTRMVSHAQGVPTSAGLSFDPCAERTHHLFTIHYSLFTKFFPQLLWNVQNFSVHNRPADFFHKSLSITVISIHRRLCSGKP